MSAEYTVAAKVFQNKEFLKTAIGIAEGGVEPSFDRESPIAPNATWECSYSFPDSTDKAKITLNWNFATASKVVPQPITTSIFEPNPVKRFKEKAEALREEIRRLEAEEKDLLTQREEVTKAYKKAEKNYRMSKDLKKRQESKALQLIQEVEKDLERRCKAEVEFYHNMLESLKPSLPQ